MFNDGLTALWRSRALAKGQKSLGDRGAQRVVTQAETETFVWLPINNILRCSPKQATGMKYLLAKCNNWQREAKSARSHCFSLEDRSSSNGLSSLSFLDIFFYFLGLQPLVLQNKHSWNSEGRKSEHSSWLRDVPDLAKPRRIIFTDAPSVLFP